MRQGKKLAFKEVWEEKCCRSVNNFILLFRLQQKNLYVEKKNRITGNGLGLETGSLLTAV